MKEDRSVSGFLQRLRRCKGPEAFKKDCEAIAAGELTGVYDDFMDLFDVVVDLKGPMLERDNSATLMVHLAIHKICSEQKRVAPVLVEDGYRRVRITRRR